MSQNDETLVGKIIHEIIPIEWMRYNMYIEDDKYRNIPMLVFRVQDTCSDSLLENLKNSIDSFEGKLIWKIFKNPLSRKGNYLLSISELEDWYKQCHTGEFTHNQIEFFGTEKYKKYCNDAIYDIPMLAKHIIKTLKV